MENKSMNESISALNTKITDTENKSMNENISDLNTKVTDEVILHTPGMLQSRNVRIHKRRTSVRLEPEMWNALNEIAELERCSVHDLCGAVHDLKEIGASFTASLRVFMMEYYRSVALVNGHVSQIQKKIRINQAEA
ncbi:MAG: ribbon-helix-helix domain-containing protein [Alphaproteobacteria bacterium]|nr:ribbon-helix-helix domain-containing protein [Alphaproteobacteria bacterium]